MTARPTPDPDIVVNGAGPGAVVHVIATDPAAPLDLPACCHMTGHTYLGAASDDDPQSSPCN